jgi:hypothetical protein
LIREYKRAAGEEAKELKGNVQELDVKISNLLNVNLYREFREKKIKISREEFLRLNPFHWGFEFYEAFDPEKPKEERGFDVVIGNPPYGIVFNNNEKAFIEDQYPTFKRNNDIFVAFMQKCIILLKSDGLFSFIVPNTFLTGPYFNRLKEYILNTTKILKLLDFGTKQVFIDPNVFNAIIILQKEKNEEARNNNIVELIDILNSDELATNNLKISKRKQSELTDYHWKPVDAIVDKISRIKPKLGDIAFVKDVGLNYWTKGRGKKRGGSIGSRILYTGKKQHDDDIPYLKGGSINRYMYEFGNHWLKYDYKTYLDPEVDIFRYSPKYLERDVKIIYRQTADRIIATIDKHQYYLDKSVHLIVLRENHENEYDMKYLLAILNSKLATHFYRDIAKELGRTFAQVKTFNIKKIPIFPATQKQHIFITLCNCMLFLNETEERRKTEKELIEYIDKQIIDSLVYELYFQEKFKEDGLKTNLLGFVEPYLKDIGTLKTKEEKLKVVKEIVEEIKSDDKVKKEIKRIKGHEWVKEVEGWL